MPCFVGPRPKLPFKDRPLKIWLRPPWNFFWKDVKTALPALLAVLRSPSFNPKTPIEKQLRKWFRLLRISYWLRKPMPMAVLWDINVLLPLIHGAHLHHRSAASWVNQHQEDGDLVL
ncbi:hypothetical protein CfE428DRAFT_1663 [Chthoniobacter flavus Ellin428]|uniref:Uncharacterized protein n=1 Tax=Chthoniobacter flavus Ellin428 TaxID=497964 RepID=B4CYC5_9BACT|nr:hypothetical protein CfE428DRAFT_1663 [Chthoniobacter flavus Ellin428]TCO85590.1 hypothetical protein EV701_13147 [Chthoniobacter flavus]